MSAEGVLREIHEVAGLRQSAKQLLKLGYRNLSGELRNPSEFVRNRAPHRSAEELRETMDLLRKRQKEMSKAPADTTRGSGGRIDGGDEPF